MWEVLQQEFADLGSLPDLFRLILRLLVAVLLSGALGYQRTSVGKAAGLRTHMLVGLAAALPVAAVQIGAVDREAASRVIQGLVTGIGFIGGGAILKRARQREVHGLTTAAGLWLVTAVGITAGLGRLGLAVLGTGLAYLILTVVYRLEEYMDGGDSV